jgi:hypothetical protein
MTKLRCGVILLDDFILYLRDRWRTEYVAHFGQILVIEFLRCKEGARAGQTWLEIFWMAPHGLSESCLFSVEKVTLYLSPQTQKGLKDHYLGLKSGVPFVG